MDLLRKYFLKAFSPFHTFVFRATGGRLMGRFGMPVLILTTTGARTGRRRTAPLLCLEEDGALLVVASLWGGPRHPAWYHNLIANPTVEVETRAGRRTMRAEPAPAEERRRLYDLFSAAASHYASYEARTERTIPVVVLRATED